MGLLSKLKNRRLYLVVGLLLFVVGDVYFIAHTIGSTAP